MKIKIPILSLNFILVNSISFLTGIISFHITGSAGWSLVFMLIAYGIVVTVYYIRDETEIEDMIVSHSEELALRDTDSVRLTLMHNGVTYDKLVLLSKMDATIETLRGTGAKIISVTPFKEYSLFDKDKEQGMLHDIQDILDNKDKS